MEKFDEIVQDILDRGWTQQQIAREVGCSQPVISELLNGETIQPRYGTARMLVDLWKSRRKPPR